MKELIEKYLTNTITSSEMMDLSNWLKKYENKEVFKAYILQHYDLNYALQDVDVEQEYITLMKSINKQKNSYTRWYKWAAIFVGVVVLNSLYFSNIFDEEVTENNEITLKLENGDVKIIREKNNEKIVNKEGTIVSVYQDDKLKYENTKVNDKELVYNELSIPYGKKLKLVLSDGSMVHLNAGSTLKYPVKFIKGRDRKVFLCGEAYFVIEKDKQHPFIVNTQGINVQALGTEFNVNSYREDIEMNTVLIEGSVGVYKAEEKFDTNTSTVLQPGYKFTWNKSQHSMDVKEVNVSEYTAWTKGVLIFKMKPFSEIVKILERNYDVVITNNYKALNEKRFLAKFDTETIEQVLKSFQSSEEFSFTIEENRITINKQ